MLPGSIRLPHLNSMIKSSTLAKSTSWQIKSPWYNHSSTWSYQALPSLTLSLSHTWPTSFIYVKTRWTKKESETQKRRANEQGRRDDRYYNTLPTCNIWSITYEIRQKALGRKSCYTCSFNLKSRLDSGFHCLLWTSIRLHSPEATSLKLHLSEQLHFRKHFQADLHATCEDSSLQTKITAYVLSEVLNYDI